MSILIKGMEMPKNCAWCRFLQSTDPIPKRELFCGIDTTNNIHDYRPDKGCPLVPVPPHGRLIDADAYEELIRGLGNREYRRENGTICDAIKFLHPHYAPTIIPAEEAKDTNVPTYDLLYEEGGAGTT